MNNQPANVWAGTDEFIPHGFCLSWDPDLMAMVVLSNALIAIAYMVIASVLVAAAIQPKPVVPRWLYWSFAGFIFCCGLTHVLDNLTLWVPIYRLQASVLGITAFAAVFAALLPLSIWVTREMEKWRR